MALDLPEAAAREIVARALAEDIGDGDVTTLVAVPPESVCRAEIVAKADGIIAGLPVARLVFQALDPRVGFEARAADGSRVGDGTVVAEVSGPTRGVLTGERAALNFMQRMSGIATLTARYVGAVEGTQAKIVDTRKTAPGLRALDKYAVHAGGGSNHRMGLFDGVLIKENHIRAAGGVEQAVKGARAGAHHLLRIEVEAETLEDVEAAAAAGADVILLDNMSPEQVSEAVKHISGRCEVEVSGGVTLDTVRRFAEAGVDFISVGALTHSACALDLSLEIRDG